MRNTTLIAVAPNGARRGRKDHAAIPLTSDELSIDALACMRAGAAMIHLHVRDPQHSHTLGAGLYDEAVTSVRASTAGRMLIQLTSEAAGRYDADEQIEAATVANPAFLSLALREIFPVALPAMDVKKRMARIAAIGTARQIILYSVEELERFERLCDEGMFEDGAPVLLFVAGGYAGGAATAHMIDAFTGAMRCPHRWMACAFGADEQEVLCTAADAGGHVRTGFENNLFRQDGRLAESNAQLVEDLAEALIRRGHTISTYENALDIMSETST